VPPLHDWSDTDSTESLLLSSKNCTDPAGSLSSLSSSSTASFRGDESDDTSWSHGDESFGEGDFDCGESGDVGDAECWESGEPRELSDFCFCEDLSDDLCEEAELTEIRPWE
jgi:hypothetical protein